MNIENQPLGILLVGHGSPRAETNERFIALAGRIAARLGMENVLPTFFSIARPNIPDRVAELVARGVRRIVLMPYFLYAGQHVTHDIPALLAECGRQFPDVAMEVLPALEDDPAIEDAVVERLTAIAAGGRTAQGRRRDRAAELPNHRRAAWPVRPGGCLGPLDHAADHPRHGRFFLRPLAAHSSASCCARPGGPGGRSANPLRCQDAASGDHENRQRGRLRDRPPGGRGAGPAGAMYSGGGGDGNAAAALDGAIVAIGNAPTALWKVLEIVRRGGPRPALVVGLPVGLVGARESKAAILESDLCYITNTGAAAAARWRPRPSMPWLCQREKNCDEKIC